MRRSRRMGRRRDGCIDALLLSVECAVLGGAWQGEEMNDRRVWCLCCVGSFARKALMR
jgi:hypothetical protein